MAADMGPGAGAQAIQEDGLCPKTAGPGKGRSSVRKPRTRFSPQQLGALRAAFQRTPHPSWGALLELAAHTQLEETVVQIWFKNQRARVKRQQPQTPLGPAPEAPRPGSAGEDTPAQASSADTGPPSPGLTGAAPQFAPTPPELPAGPEASGGPWAWAALPPDLQDLCLQPPDLPWACSPLGLDELALAYGAPSGEDPASLDQYLLPSAGPAGGSGPALPCAPPAACPDGLCDSLLQLLQDFSDIPEMKPTDAPDLLELLGFQ